MKPSDETINILGFEIITHDRKLLLSTIEAKLINGSGYCHLLAINAAKVCKGLRNRSLGIAINEAALVYPDGFGVAWAMRKKSSKRFNNIPGCEIFLDIMRIADKQKTRVYILGATESVISETQTRFQKDFPNAIIIGMRHGFFSGVEEKRCVISEIVQQRPQLIFVAMGSPIQENVISEFFDECKAQNIANLLAMGLGGSLDIYTGHVQRAPRLFIKLRLEWFYRFMTQPFYRFTNTLLIPKFAGLFLASHYLKYHKYR